MRECYSQNQFEMRTRRRRRRTGEDKGSNNFADVIYRSPLISLFLSSFSIGVSGDCNVSCRPNEQHKTERLEERERARRMESNTFLSAAAMSGRRRESICDCGGRKRDARGGLLSPKWNNVIRQRNNEKAKGTMGIQRPHTYYSFLMSLQVCIVPELKAETWAETYTSTSGRLQFEQD